MVDKDMFQSMLLDEFYKQMPDDFILSVKDVFKENDTKMTGINLHGYGFIYTGRYAGAYNFPYGE